MDMDEGSKSKLKLVYPDLSPRIFRIFQDVFLATGYSMRITEGLRSMERQQALYAQGRTTPGPRVTNAKPGESLHHYGCAIDACFQGPDPYLEKVPPTIRERVWKTYGKFVKEHGMEWGGDWNGNGVVDKNDFDKPHCQLLYGLQPTYIRELYLSGGLRAVWGAFDKVRGIPIGQEWEKLVQDGKLVELSKPVV